MQRARITITVDPEILAALDQLVDRSLVRNRSHAIEHVLRTGLALQELRQVFIILGDTLPEPTLIQQLVAIQQYFTVSTYYLIAPAAAMPLVTSFTASLRQFGLNEAVGIEVLPGDFGSGAALLLRREVLMGTFLILELGMISKVPSTLLAAYAFHRQQQAITTHMVHPHQASFEEEGIIFAEPTLLAHIPAGIADLRKDVFPVIRKAAKVSAYVNLSQ